MSVEEQTALFRGVTAEVKNGPTRMTTQQRERDAIYVMGRTDHESRRLELQDGLFNAWTRGLFARAGIGPGMHVLDVGSGTGAVARLAAELVGEQGSVTGVDLNPAILETARPGGRRRPR